MDGGILTGQTGRFLAALGVLAVGLIGVQSIFGGNVGLYIALGFAFWFLVRNDLEAILASPFRWATKLLEG